MAVKQFAFHGAIYKQVSPTHSYRDGKRIPTDEFRAAEEAREQRNLRLEAISEGAVDYAQAEPKAEPAPEPGAKPGRRPRDVAFEHGGTTLTARQLEFVRAMSSEESMGSPEGGWWIDLLIDGAELSPMSAGAMVSTMREKGLVTVSAEVREDGDGRKRRARYMRLTDRGADVYAAAVDHQRGM